MTELVIANTNGDDTVKILNAQTEKVRAISQQSSLSPLFSISSELSRLKKFGAFQPFSGNVSLIGVIEYTNPNDGERHPWIFLGQEGDKYKIFEWPQTVDEINKYTKPEAVPYKPILNV